jgi:hypothetical protein
MVNWWPAEGAANDLAGTNNGTEIGGLSYVLGQAGFAFNFESTNTYIGIGASNIPPPWTACFWVKRQNAFGSSAALLANTYPIVFPSTSYALKLEQHNLTRKVGISVYGAADYSFNYIAPVGIWTHLVFVGTTTNTSLYANGALQGSLPVSISLPRTYIGTGLSSGGFIDHLRASVDEIILFNRALSLGEINTVYTIGSVGQYVGPTATSLPLVSLADAPLLSVTCLTDGSLEFKLSAALDQICLIEASTNLIDWVPICTNLSAGSVITFTDAQAATLPYRFYRAVQTP